MHKLPETQGNTFVFSSADSLDNGVIALTKPYYITQSGSELPLLKSTLDSNAQPSKYQC